VPIYAELQVIETDKEIFVAGDDAAAAWAEPPQIGVPHQFFGAYESTIAMQLRAQWRGQ
jgi:hypothetical protein